MPQLNDFEIGLLVGLLEGEGTITIQRMNKGYYPRIVISNTDTDLIELSHSLLGKLMESRHKVYRHYSSKAERLKGWKPSWVVRVTSMKDILLVLEFLENYLVSSKKRELCKLVLEFCRSRLAKTQGRKRGLWTAKDFSSRELEIISRVRLLNKKGL
jgi:DNA primase large subunit